MDRPVKSKALLIQVEQRIFLIRGQNVMLSHDLAQLYGVQTGALNRAVRRKPARFPDDFMFQLSKKQWDGLKCQIGISSSSVEGSGNVTPGWGGSRLPPYAFTEQGVAMRSSVLRRPLAKAFGVRPAARDADVERGPRSEAARP